MFNKPVAPLWAAPSLQVGHVMHRRLRPCVHAFVYPVFFVRLPLSRLHEAGNALFSVDRFNALSVRLRDHGPRDGSAWKPWVQAILREHGLPDDGEVVLQTFPRVFGFVFNPVSFWYCHDQAGGLRAVLCEVNNTFGEHHNYLVAHDDRRVIDADDVLRAEKVFHVSPFFAVRGEYRFSFRQRADRHTVAIDYFDQDAKQLTTRLVATPEALTAKRLLGAWLRCPLLTLGVVARINLQALRLLAKRVPFFHKPALTAEETT